MSFKKFRAEFRSAIPEEQIIVSPDALAAHAEDWTEIPGHAPDLLIKARSTNEIQAVLRAAHKYHIPIVPRVANTNIGGLAIAEKGGAMLDLTGMNRILEVNEPDMYAVIEPGVTWADMKSHLAARHPRLRFAYSLSPPKSSVLANCLMDGLTNLSLLHGTTAHWINGLEAVLPNGEIVRTGIGAISENWCTKSPLPDLTGLFINFHGTTGIITKLSVQLWPNHPFRKRLFVLAYDTEPMYDLITDLVRAEVCDDIGGLSWPVGKMLFGELNPLYRDPNEPEQFLYIDVSAEYEDLFDCKLNVVERIIREARSRGAGLEPPIEVSKLVRISPRFEKLADFPVELDFLLELGGLTWIGTFGPTSRWKEGVTRGMRLMEERGFPPIVVTRPMHGGHFGVLRFIAVFDKKDERRVKQVRELNEALCDLVISLGFFPYKTPPWVIQRHRDKIDPGFLNLLRLVRSAIDPNGIMNPGKWPLE
jgi:glycolate oxidase